MSRLMYFKATMPVSNHPRLPWCDPLRETSFITNVGYGMQCARVTEDGIKATLLE